MADGIKPRTVRIPPAVDVRIEAHRVALERLCGVPVSTNAAILSLVKLGLRASGAPTP